MKFAVLKDLFVVHMDHEYASKKMAHHNVGQMAKFVSYLITRYDAPTKDFETDFVIRRSGPDKYPKVFWRPRRELKG